MSRETLQLLERTSAFGADAVPSDRIDRVKGVIRGPLKVLGLSSANGRDYLPEATRKAVPLIEGSPVYVDHPTGRSNARSLNDRFGRLKGVYADDKGEVWAKELHFIPSHSYADNFLWLVENDPKGIGFSINAEGYGSPDPKTGRRAVNEIFKVHSTDLVDGPGTVGGLFEQAGNAMSTPALADPAAPMTPATQPADGSGEGGDHKDALAEAVASLAKELQSGDCDHASARKKITALLKMIAPDEKEEPEPKDDADSEAAAKITEQLVTHYEPSVRWAAKVLREARVTRLVESKLVAAKLPDGSVTDTFRLSLREAAGDPAKMDRLIADRKAVTGGRSGPKSAPPQAGPDASKTKMPNGETIREQAAGTETKQKSAVAGYLEKLSTK